MPPKVAAAVGPDRRRASLPDGRRCRRPTGDDVHEGVGRLTLRARRPDGRVARPRSPHPMRIIFRALAATAAVAALMLGTGASTALAAGDSSPATVAHYEFGDAWCIDFGVQYDCTVTDGTMTVTITPDGRETALIHFRETVTSYDPSGVQIGTFKVVRFDRTVFADGGQDSTFTV